MLKLNVDDNIKLNVTLLVAAQSWSAPSLMTYLTHIPEEDSYELIPNGSLHSTNYSTFLIKFHLFLYARRSTSSF